MLRLLAQRRTDWVRGAKASRTKMSSRMAQCTLLDRPKQTRRTGFCRSGFVIRQKKPIQDRSHDKRMFSVVAFHRNWESGRSSISSVNSSRRTLNFARYRRQENWIARLHFRVMQTDGTFYKIARRIHHKRRSTWLRCTPDDGSATNSVSLSIKTDDVSNFSDSEDELNEGLDVSMTNETAEENEDLLQQLKEDLVVAENRVARTRGQKQELESEVINSSLILLTQSRLFLQPKASIGE